jgi:hypothetical protein
MSSGPACQPLVPRRPPLSRGNSGGHRPGADAGHLSCPPPRPDPLPLSSPPAPPSHHKKALTVVPFPLFCPALSHPRSSTPPPPPSSALLDFLQDAVVRPLGEPLAVPLLAFLGPQLTFLPLSPWCRTRAVSSATTVPAPPPPNATAPPTRRYWGEPHLRSPYPAHPPLSRVALAQDLAALGPPLR